MEPPGLLEGTWEEIRSHDAELAGHRVRVIVLDLEPADERTLVEEGESGPFLDEVLKGRIGKFDFGRSDLARRSEELFGEIVTKKHSSAKKPDDPL